MYYKVISDGHTYYSKEILKSFLHVGDDVIQRRVMTGAIPVKEIMDRMVYELPEDSWAEVDSGYSPVVQDLDARFASFYVPADGELASCDRVQVNPDAERYGYHGMEFVRFSEVRSRSRYKDQTRLPIVEVCGVKYVALGILKDVSETMYAR